MDPRLYALHQELTPGSRYAHGCAIHQLPLDREVKTGVTKVVPFRVGDRRCGLRLAQEAPPATGIGDEVRGQVPTSGTRIDCLMGTCGRHSLACEALACFLQQSVSSQATLLIYNQHPVPLHFDHPHVRVVNEAAPAGSLRHVRQRMHELADPSAEFFHWWDDDDLYLPWHLEDCLAHIGGNVAWKPTSSWISRNAKFSRQANTFEGSWMFRADYLKAAALDTHPTYTDHPVIRQTAESGRLATTELGGRTSYIYRCATGAEHVSGYGASGSELTQHLRLQLWRHRSDDVRSDGRLAPADLSLRWRQYLDGTKGQVTSAEWELNRKGVGF